MDEVAAHVKADPVEYRLTHLNHARLSAAVRAAAKAATWEQRPSPQPRRARAGKVSGRGIACVCYEGDNGYVAMVADVTVDQDSGRIRVTRLVIAQDSGPISNPDGMRNQIEGGALQGISRALGEEVTWDDRRITSVDWNSYHSPTSASRLRRWTSCSSIRLRSKPAVPAKRQSQSWRQRLAKCDLRCDGGQTDFGKCLLLPNGYFQLFVDNHSRRVTVQK